MTWRSKKLSVVARSNVKAEVRAMSQGTCEIIWLSKVLKELRIMVECPMKLYCDGKAVISIAHNRVQHDRTKHIEIDRHFIKEQIEAGETYLPFAPNNSTGR